MSDNDKIKVCPACATAFTCSPVDCWCSKLPLVMPMIEGAECYCPGCLAAVIKELPSSAASKVA